MFKLTLTTGVILGLVFFFLNEYFALNPVGRIFSLGLSFLILILAMTSATRGMVGFLIVSIFSAKENRQLSTLKTLGDEKLTDQIGNTITYFTRSHVSRVAEVDVDADGEGVSTNIDDVAAAEIDLEESIAFPMWNKIK